MWSPYLKLGFQLMRHMMAQDDVCIVSAVRTPLGSFLGSLSSLSATDLGAKAALERAQVPSSVVDEVFMGNVCSGNLGQAPATQAMIRAGLPPCIPCTGVNKVCVSDMSRIYITLDNHSG